MLVFPNWDRVSEILGRYGLPVTPAALRQAEPAVRFAVDTATAVTDWNDADRGGRYFHGLLDAAGVPRSSAREAALDEVYAYHSEHNLWEHVPDEVRPALDQLHAQGVKLAVASNANGTVLRVFDRLGLTRYFDTIGDSHLEGVEKPNPRFFEILLERTGSRADATLHVGDMYHIDVVGARRAGLRALMLDPHDFYRAFDVERVRTLSEVGAHLATA